MRFVRLCAAAELPAVGKLCEFVVEGRALCVANDGGRLAAVDNVCPHRQGPLAEGMLENGKVLCPWHAWAFDLKTGEAEHDPAETVAVFPVVVQGSEVVVGVEP